MAQRGREVGDGERRGPNQVQVPLPIDPFTVLTILASVFPSYRRPVKHALLLLLPAVTVASCTVQSTLYAVPLRWYALGRGRLQPYLEASAGYVSAVELPMHPDCGDGSGFSAQLALGLDWEASSWARFGVVAAARPFLSSRGCIEPSYSGQAPNPPRLGLLLAGQLAFTTVWSPL